MDNPMLKRYLDDIWCDGYELAALRTPDTHNPYPSGTPEHDAWNAGWKSYQERQQKAA
jgi:hypothetical protein